MVPLNMKLMCIMINAYILVNNISGQSLFTKSITVSPNTLPTTSDVSINIGNNVNNRSNEWLIDVRSQTGSDIHISTTSEWGFHSTYPSTISLIINGSTPNSTHENDGEIIFLYAVNNEYFSDIVSIDQRRTAAKQCPDQDTPLWLTNVDSMITASFPQRYYRFCKNPPTGNMDDPVIDYWQQHSPRYKSTAHWPMFISITNNPILNVIDYTWTDNLNQINKVSSHYTSSFAPNEGLNMFISADNMFESFIISSISISYKYNATAPVSTSTNPTVKPTTNPSFNPSVTPSVNPSHIPSTNPSDMPSFNPSNVPTTMFPSTNPTLLTLFPSINPSFNPTNNPIITTTNIPTISPSNYPIISPTNNPIIKPSNYPILLPTNMPTNNPIVTSTHNPSLIPTISPTNNPIRTPTNNPIRTPTNNPIRIPTNNPIRIPTNNPIRTPTNNPIRIPTNNPIRTPTNNPTLLPTKSPTYTPTNNPTHIPTVSPTPNPTLSPTNNPIAAPTNTPTYMPSNKPTVKPTLKPIAPPTLNPTPQPTNKPSKNPTPDPTPIPSMRPTKNPSYIPSYNPTAKPTITIKQTLDVTHWLNATINNYESINSVLKLDSNVLTMPIIVVILIISLTLCSICIVTVRQLCKPKGTQVIINHKNETDSNGSNTESVHINPKGYKHETYHVHLHHKKFSSTDSLADRNIKHFYHINSIPYDMQTIGIDSLQEDQSNELLNHSDSIKSIGNTCGNSYESNEGILYHKRSTHTLISEVTDEEENNMNKFIQLIADKRNTKVSDQVDEIYANEVPIL